MIKLTIKNLSLRPKFDVGHILDFLAVKCPLENYSKPYGRVTAMPPAWGLSE